MAILEIQGQQVDIPDWDNMDDATRDSTVNEIASSMQSSTPQQPALEGQQPAPVQQQQQLQQPQQQGGFRTDTPPTDTPTTQVENQLAGYARTGQDARNLNQAEANASSVAQNQVITNERLRRTNDVQSTTDRVRQTLKVDPAATFERDQQPSSQEVMDSLINGLRSSNGQAPTSRAPQQPPQTDAQRLADIGITEPQQAASEPQEREIAGGIVDMLAQGLTFGYSDEIEARGQELAGNSWEYVKSLITDEAPQYTNYEDNLAQVRARMDQFREESPVIATTAEVAGSLPVSIAPAGLAGRAAGLGGKAATLAGVGAAEGALSASGTTTAETGSDRWFDEVGKGSATGAVLAPILGIAGEKVVDIASRLPFLDRLQGGNARLAQESIRKYATDNNLPIDDVVDRLSRLDQGGLADISLADIDELRPLIKQLNRTTNIDPSIQSAVSARADAQTTALSRNLDPVREQGETIITRRQDIPDAPSVSPDEDSLLEPVNDAWLKNFTADKATNLDSSGRLRAGDLAKEMKADTKAIVDPLYRDAFVKNLVRYGDIPKKLRDTTEFKQAHKAAVEDVKTYNALNNITSPVSQTHVLHQMQQLLGDFGKAQGGLGGSNYFGIQRVINNALEEGSDEYRAAKSIFRQDTQSIKALNQGEALGTGSLSTREVQDVASKLEETGSVDAAMITYGQKLADKIDNGWRDGKSGNILSAKDREDLKEILRTQPEKYNITEGLYNAADRAKRTRFLANMDTALDRRNWAEALNEKMNFNDGNAIFSALAFVAQPSLGMAGWALRKFGESAFLRRDSVKMRKEMQRELFKASSPESVRAFFTGELDQVPADHVKGIMRVLGIVGGNELTKDDIRQTNRYEARNQ